MSIKRKELVNRKYDMDKNIVSFDYYSEMDEDEWYRVTFNRVGERDWQFICVNFVNYVDTGISVNNTQTYTGSFTMPKPNMDLDIIAFVGLDAMCQVFTSDYATKSVWASKLSQKLGAAR